MKIKRQFKSWEFLWIKRNISRVAHQYTCEHFTAGKWDLKYLRRKRYSSVLCLLNSVAHASVTPLTCLQSSFQLISSPPNIAGEINILHHPLAGNRLPWEFPFKPQTTLSHLNFAQLIVESSHQHPHEKGEFTLKAQIILYLHVQHFLWLAEGPSAFFCFVLCLLENKCSAHTEVLCELQGGMNIRTCFYCFNWFCGGGSRCRSAGFEF